ncbi:hypothetical protein GZL_02818 [Streptomyces sp. 769]|nr:hypothetical protein GZL_02818 [Streptomyces sp. 769]
MRPAEDGTSGPVAAPACGTPHPDQISRPRDDSHRAVIASKGISHVPHRIRGHRTHQPSG